MSRVAAPTYGNHRFPMKMPIATLGAGAGITPVQNTTYTILSTKNVRIKTIAVNQTNDEAANKGIILTIATDSSSENYTGNIGNNVYSKWRITASGGGLVVGTAAAIVHPGMYVALDAKSALITIKFTSAPGTNQLLFASVQYEQLGEVANP